MSNKQAVWDMIILAVIGMLFFGLFLGSYHLITPDEGRYVEVAREMFVSHNFITPHLDGTVFLDKPILYYWLESACIKLLGVSEWSVRLVPAVFGLIGVLFNYWAGYKLYNRRTGFISALVLMTMLLYFLTAHYADMDLMVAVLMEIALWLFIVAIRLPKPGVQRDITLWCAYAVAALAFLTKGLMGLVFPAMIIGAWILLLSRWRVITQMRLASGLFLFIVLVAPWYTAVQYANPEFFNYFFIVQQFSRYTTSGFNAQQPLYFYFVVIVVGIFPWTIFLFQSLFYTFKQLRYTWKKADIELFLLLWVFLILIFFSIPKSKIVGYIIPVFPPLALLIAHYLSEHWGKLRGSKNLLWSMIAFLILSAALAFSLIYTAHLNSIATSASFNFLCSMAVIISAGAVFTLWLVVDRYSFRKVFLAMILVTMVMDIIGAASAKTYKLNNVKPLAIKLRQLLKPGDEVATFNKYYQDLPVYINRTVYVVDNWQDSSIALNDTWRRELAEGIIYKHKQQPLLISYQEFSQLWNSKAHRLFVLTSSHKVAQLKGIVHSPVYQLGHFDGTVLLSNQD